MMGRAFRKAGIDERRSLLQTALTETGALSDSLLRQAMAASLVNPDQLRLSDQMVENAFGSLPIPLGLATGFLIDGQGIDLPLATEEPSVIAAASFMGTQIARYGGFITASAEPLITGCIYIEQAADQGLEQIQTNIPLLEKCLEPLLASMRQRGGGLRGIQAEYLDHQALIKVSIDVDARDAMGANLVNSCAESLRGDLESLSGGRVLMAILTNQALGRLSQASFRFPIDQLGRAGFTGPQMAQRIIRANQVAALDVSRAITHNKGIMNGISALALATSNDTRAIEAAAHAWASRGASYQPLTEYRQEGGDLIGSIALPLPFGCVGGAISSHPVAQLNLGILGRPSAQRLSQIAAALGLAQNFAALNALVGEGIQVGHMPLHARRQESTPS